MPLLRAADTFCFALVAASLALAGCDGAAVPVPALSETEPRREVEPAPSQDPEAWTTRPPREITKGEFQHRLASSKSEFITEEARDEALRRLERVDWVRLDASEIERFAGHPMEVGPGEVPALIRGVARARKGDWDGEHDKIILVWKDGIVIVTHMAFRTPPAPPFIRAPIVAVLPAEPTVIYGRGFVSM